MPATSRLCVLVVNSPLDQLDLDLLKQDFPLQVLEFRYIPRGMDKGIILRCRLILELWPPKNAYHNDYLSFYGIYWYLRNYDT